MGIGWLIAFCALLGLVVGSFLNVVIYRVPRNESIVTPRSFCPACHAPIAERDNVPVLSWILLRGRCRHCGASISARYPMVEGACAVLFAGLAARFGYRWDLPAFLALFAGLLALSCIDVERMILPKKIVYPMTVAVAVLLLVAAAETGRWHAYLIGLACAAGWFVVFYALFLISPKLLGFGDVRLSAVARPRPRLVGRLVRPSRVLCSEPDRGHRRSRADLGEAGRTAGPRFPMGSSSLWVVLSRSLRGPICCSR